MSSDDKLVVCLTVVVCLTLLACIYPGKLCPGGWRGGAVSRGWIGDHTPNFNDGRISPEQVLVGCSSAEVTIESTGFGVYLRQHFQNKCFAWQMKLEEGDKTFTGVVQRGISKLLEQQQGAVTGEPVHFEKCARCARRKVF